MLVELELREVEIRNLIQGSCMSWSVLSITCRPDAGLTLLFDDDSGDANSRVSGHLLGAKPPALEALLPQLRSTV